MIKEWYKTMARKIRTKFKRLPTKETPPSRFPSNVTHQHNDSNQPKATTLRSKVASITNNAIRMQERIEIDGEKQRILMKDSSNVNRILLDSKNGVFKLSQTSEDVLTATDDKLIWSSDFNMFKIIASDTVTIPQASAGYPGTTQTSVTASIEGTGIEDPFAFTAFVEQGGGFDPLPLVADIGGDSLNIAYQVFARSFIEDNTPKIKFFLNNNDSAAVGPLKVKYYAFIETAKVA